MSAPPLDLLIIGAGPVGLSTAVAAIHRGVKRIRIVDQARELRPVGQTIDLLPNAVRFLSALSPEVRPLLQPFIKVTPAGEARARSVTTKGNELPPPTNRDFGELASLAWWQLQRVLLDALPDQSILILNHQFVDFVHGEDGLVCAEFVADRVRENKFKNWEGDYDKVQDYLMGKDLGVEKEEVEEEGVELGGNGERRVRIKAKMVVGADGINSAVRKCVYREKGQGWEEFTDPVYSGFTRVGALVGHDVQFDEDAVEYMKERFIKNALLVLMTCDRDKISASSPRAMVVHPSSEHKTPLAWVTIYFLPIEEEVIKTTSNRDLTYLALDMLKQAEYPEQLLRISAKAWQSMSNNDIAVRKHYTVPAKHPLPYEAPPTMTHVQYPEGFERPWWHRRVVLVGDAVHAAPNFLAQGAAMGIEDAYELVVRIAKSGIWQRAQDDVPTEQELETIFKSYYDARLDRICFFQSRTIRRISEFDEDAVNEQSETLFAYQPLTEQQVVL